MCALPLVYGIAIVYVLDSSIIRLLTRLLK